MLLRRPTAATLTNARTAGLFEVDGLGGRTKPVPGQQMPSYRDPRGRRVQAGSWDAGDARSDVSGVSERPHRPARSASPSPAPASPALPVASPATLAQPAHHAAASPTPAITCAPANPAGAGWPAAGPDARVWASFVVGSVL